MHAFAMPTRQSTRPGSREFPLRLRQADRRARASRIAWSPDALHAEGCRTGVGGHSQGRGTFVAGRRPGGFLDSPHVRTSARNTPERRMPAMRPVLFPATCELPSTPLVRATTPQSKPKRFPYAYEAHSPRPTTPKTRRLRRSNGPLNRRGTHLSNVDRSRRFSRKAENHLTPFVP